MAQHKSPKTPQGSPRSTYNDITRSLRIGDEARVKNAAYVAAATGLVARRRIDGTFAISSSAFSAQRKLALQSCGSDWEEDSEVVCQRCASAEGPLGASADDFHLEGSCRGETMKRLLGMLSSQGDLSRR